MVNDLLNAHAADFSAPAGGGQRKRARRHRNRKAERFAKSIRELERDFDAVFEREDGGRCVQGVAFMLGATVMRPKEVFVLRFHGTPPSTQRIPNSDGSVVDSGLIRRCMNKLIRSMILECTGMFATNMRPTTLSGLVLSTHEQRCGTFLPKRNLKMGETSASPSVNGGGGRRRGRRVGRQRVCRYVFIDLFGSDADPVCCTNNNDEGGDGDQMDVDAEEDVGDTARQAVWFLAKPKPKGFRGQN